MNKNIQCPACFIMSIIKLRAYKIVQHTNTLKKSGRTSCKAWKQVPMQCWRIKYKSMNKGKVWMYAAISELNLKWKLKRPIHKTLSTYQTTFIFSKVHCEKVTPAMQWWRIKNKSTNNEKSVNARNVTSTKLIIYTASSELNLQWKLKIPIHKTLSTYQNTFILSIVLCKKNNS